MDNLTMILTGAIDKTYGRARDVLYFRSYKNILEFDTNNNVKYFVYSLEKDLIGLDIQATKEYNKNQEESLKKFYWKEGLKIASREVLAMLIKRNEGLDIQA